MSVAGLAANALAGPFVGPSTVLGFAAAGSSLMSGTAAATFGCGAAWGAQVIIWIARTPGTLDWWVKERQAWWGRVRGRRSATLDQSFDLRPAMIGSFESVYVDETL